MQILTDCPVLLGSSKVFDREPEAVALRDLPDATRKLWQVFAGDAQPWRFPWMKDEIPHGLAIVVERSKQSQFDQLVQLAREEDFIMPDILACVALAGENFHGQRERPWRACLGNLHLSVYFRAGLPAANLNEEISILPTLALMDALALEPHPQIGTGIRWLNDLFIQGKKVAGSIAASEIEGDELKAVIYGIGMNVEVTPEVEPSPFVRRAGCLRELLLEQDWSVGKAFFALSSALHRRFWQLKHGQSDDFVREFIAGSACIGRAVRVWPEKVDVISQTPPIAQGRLNGINDDLSLSISGLTEPVTNGRLAFEEDCLALGL